MMGRPQLFQYLLPFFLVRIVGEGNIDSHCCLPVHIVYLHKQTDNYTYSY